MLSLSLLLYTWLRERVPFVLLAFSEKIFQERRRRTTTNLQSSHLHSSEMKKFYTIMMPGFMTELNLPLEFSKWASGEFSGKAEVRSCLGSWKMRVGKVRSEERFYLYGNGWNRFVKKHELRHSECVVFEHRGSFRFDATVYLSSGCLKNLSLQSQAFTNVDRASEQSVDHSFTRILSAHSGGDCPKRNTSRLYLPTKIWKYNSDFAEKKKAVLQMSGLKNTIRLANLTHYPGITYDRFTVAEGWYEFAAQNHINKGHYCKFEITLDASRFGYPKNTMIITVTKME